jgi:epoxyqueuosine reductase
MSLTEAIKHKALELGFDAVGITTAEAVEPCQAQYLKNWLTAGYAGQMRYMHNNIEKRTNPAELLGGARSVICMALNYRPENLNKNFNPSRHARIANFALFQDYHSFIKKRLCLLVDFINSAVDSENPKFKICVDSAPLLERAFAQRAGIGYIGKNHMLINPHLGLQILLSEIVTDLELVADIPMEDKCNSCDECIKACPTGALGVDGSFNANKCISYLTIEHSGQIPETLTEKINGHLFCCDECILACPKDKNAPAHKNKDLRFRTEMQYPDPAEILEWEQEKFDEYFADSNIERLGLKRLKRNAQICLRNFSAD